MKKLAKELQARWETTDGLALAAEIVATLLAQRPLRDLPLDVIDDRLDLRGFRLPRDLPVRRRGSGATGLPSVEFVEALEIGGVDLSKVDFSYAVLAGFRVIDSRLDDIRFDGADCRDLRMWGVDVRGSSFVHANLRGAMLGGATDGRGCRYEGVDFNGADLRQLNSPAADYIDCDFANARMKDIDFQSSGFTRCHFAGIVEDVIFWDHGFQTGKDEPNRMEDVDFSHAELRFVEFRRLDLERVRFPTSPEHLIVSPYREVLVCALEKIATLDSRAASTARGLLEHHLKWSGSHQVQGIFHVDELNATGLGDELRAVLEGCASSTRSRAQ